MAEIKLLALDLDGTLLNGEKQISPRTRAALDRVRQQGVLVVPVTGRPSQGIPQAVLDLPGLRYTVSSNGATIRDLATGQVLLEKLLPAATCLEVLDRCAQVPMLREVFRAGVGYLSQGDYETLRARYAGTSMLQYHLDTRQVLPGTVAEFLQADPRPVEELFFLTGSPQEKAALRDLLTGKRLSERRLQRLAEVGLGGGRTFRAVLFRPGLPGTPLPVTPFYEEETEEAWLAQGAAYLRQVLDRLGDPGYLTVAEETILWLAEDPPGRPAALPQRLEAVTAALPQSAYFPALQVGVGAAFRDFRTCRASVDQARQALAHPQRRDGPVTWYDDLVDRRLFQRGGTREELTAMAERLLGPLLQPEHQALLDTLICYLDHNGNAKATAQAMFLHPNTLHYRLRKIQSLLHRDLGQSEDFFQVMLGRKLYDFITKN